MHVLYFNLATDVTDPILGFSTRWLCALAQKVDAVHVVTMRSGVVEVPENVNVYSVGKEKGYGEPRRAIEFYRILWHIVRHNPIDVCFSHMIPIFSVLAAPLLRLYKIPLITWYAHRQLTTTLKLAHHLSNHMVSSASNSYPYKKGKLSILGQGIDTNLFTPGDIQATKEPMILSVGRLAPIKGLLCLIEAISLLRKKNIILPCLFIGDHSEKDKEYVDQIYASVQRLGLEESVHFIGSVPNHEVVHWYRKCFAHVNCSPTDHSLDKAVLEAMSCGKLSLSSTQGFRNTMGQWAEFLQFPHNDPKGLAERLEQLLRLDLAARQAIGASLREQIITHHSLDLMVLKLLDVFENHHNLAMVIGENVAPEPEDEIIKGH